MPDPISWSYAAPYLAAAFLGGYVLGSLPFGMILVRLFGLGDLRSMGSGNIGATNVLRTGSKALAAATLLLDAGKGMAAVLIAHELGGPDCALLAALGAVLGHLFPVWLKFRGGKGMATTLGVLWVLAWPVGLAACITWLVVTALLRYSSVSSLVAVASCPIYAWVFMADLQLVQLTLILAVLVWLRHAANIRRLFKGEEPRIGGA